MPFSPLWAISQLLSYSPLQWLAFLGVSAAAAYWATRAMMCCTCGHRLSP
jgi:hypothetical protein